MLTEPMRLRSWTLDAPTEIAGRLFTCARPGRATHGTTIRDIEPEIIYAWIDGLPEADLLHIVSLLGTKRNHTSEFVYYPFRSSLESNEKPDIQTWLKQNCSRRFIVHEFRTVDRRPIPPEVLREAVTCVRGLIDSGQDVLVVDSGGAERTSRVCRTLGAHL